MPDPVSILGRSCSSFIYMCVYIYNHSRLRSREGLRCHRSVHTWSQAAFFLKSAIFCFLLPMDDRPWSVRACPLRAWFLFVCSYFAFPTNWVPFMFKLVYLTSDLILMSYKFLFLHTECSGIYFQHIYSIPKLMILFSQPEILQ